MYDQTILLLTFDSTTFLFNSSRTCCYSFKNASPVSSSLDLVWFLPFSSFSSSLFFSLLLSFTLKTTEQKSDYLLLLRGFCYLVKKVPLWFIQNKQSIFGWNSFCLVRDEMSNIPTSLSEVCLTLFRLTMSIADPWPFSWTSPHFHQIFIYHSNELVFSLISLSDQTEHEKDYRVQNRQAFNPDL